MAHGRRIGPEQPLQSERPEQADPDDVALDDVALDNAEQKRAAVPGGSK
jgi:hypothetical protein